MERASPYNVARGSLLATRSLTIESQAKIQAHPPCGSAGWINPATPEGSGLHCFPGRGNLRPQYILSESQRAIVLRMTSEGPSCPEHLGGHYGPGCFRGPSRPARGHFGGTSRTRYFGGPFGPRIPRRALPPRILPRTLGPHRLWRAFAPRMLRRALMPRILPRALRTPDASEGPPFPRFFGRPSASRILRRALHAPDASEGPPHAGHFGGSSALDT